MKPSTIIISVIISTFLALVTTTEADKPVLDYRTGNPIRIPNGCFITAFTNGQHFYVDKMDSPFVRLRSGPRPSYTVRLFQETSTDDDIVKTFTRYGAGFNDSTTFWNGLGDAYRITKTSIGTKDAGSFKFEETKENRVYKMFYRFPMFSKHYEIGLQVKKQNNEDIYYLAIINKTNSRRAVPKPPGIPKLPKAVVRLKQASFTFEMP